MSDGRERPKVIMPVLDSKGSRTEKEVPVEWIEEWNKIFYNVDEAIWKARSWLIDHPNRIKKDLRKFLGNWIRKDCKMKPMSTMRPLLHTDNPVRVDKKTTSEAIGKMRSLLQK